MISFQHAYKTYPNGTPALKDINLSIEKGEFVFLTGPSGAGKTTLFRLLAAYDRPTSGGVSVAGFPVDQMNSGQIPYFRRRIGMVYQDFRLLRSRTAFENIALPLEVRGDRPAEIERRVMEMLDHVGLRARANFYPEQMSGGEQQRVAIARGLVHQPGVIIADEPTGNLDPELSAEIMELFERANAQGTTVFVATHDQDLVRRKARRVVNICAGRITSEG